MFIEVHILYLTKNTYYQALVVSESENVVLKAKELLSSLEDDIIAFHVSKQIIRVMLHAQEDMVESFQEEGILRPRDAEVLIKETHKTSTLLENEWIQRLWRDVMSASQKTDYRPKQRSRRGSLEELDLTEFYSHQV